MSPSSCFCGAEALASLGCPATAGRESPTTTTVAAPPKRTSRREMGGVFDLLISCSSFESNSKLSSHRWEFWRSYLLRDISATGAPTLDGTADLGNLPHYCLQQCAN